MTEFLLTHCERMLARKALGLEYGGSVNRNRVACHLHGEDISVANRLIGKGYMVHDPARDYGSMRVFAVTLAGAKAIGKKLPPAFVLLPAAA